MFRLIQIHFSYVNPIYLKSIGEIEQHNLDWSAYN